MHVQIMPDKSIKSATDADDWPGRNQLALTRDDVMNFGYLCTLLPEGVMWGDPITPEIIREIVNAVDRAAREECAGICDELQKGFLEVGASSVALGALNCRKAIRETMK